MTGTQLTIEDALQARERATIPQILAEIEPDICRNYHKGNEESEQANLSTDKDRDRRRILRHLEAKDATCDELEVALDMRHQTCSARLAELKKNGLVIVTGERRATRTGCKAAVVKLI